MKKYFVWMVAVFCVGLISCSDDNDNNGGDILEDDSPSALVLSNGFYVANEDWFGHDNGTVNYFRNDGTIVYRAYRAVNGEDETLGATTQFATIWGDNVYFVSKQGNRLVVADAETLKKRLCLLTWEEMDAHS